MYCGECGTENQPGAQTCEVCGSSLQSGTGPQTCQVCGSPTNEHDRFCRACGSTLSSGAAGYEPGPSFVDDLPRDFNPGDLPPWLRELVDSAGAAPQFELSAANGSAAGAATGTAAVVEEAIPAWLRAERRGSAPAPMPSVPPAGQVTANARPATAQSSESSFSFLSEGDLPVWLRAPGDETPAEPAAESQAASLPAPRPSSMSSAPTTAPSPPSVSRAWLARARAVEPPARSEAAEQFAPLASLAQSGRAAHRASTSNGLQQGKGQARAHDTGEMPIVAGSAEPRRSRTLLFVLVVLAVLAVVGLAVVQFVL